MIIASHFLEKQHQESSGSLVIIRLEKNLRLMIIIPWQMPMKLLEERRQELCGIFMMIGVYA